MNNNILTIAERARRAERYAQLPNQGFFDPTLFLEFPDISFLEQKLAGAEKPLTKTSSSNTYSIFDYYDCRN